MSRGGSRGEGRVLVNLIDGEMETNFDGYNEEVLHLVAIAF